MTEWKIIQEFPNYEVSDEGQVRSCDGWRQFGPHQRYVKGRIVKGRLHSGGYLYVSFWNGDKQVNRYIHRLVADAFIPNPLGLPQVNHLHEDGDKTRNVKGNLEWSTPLQNITHSKNVLIGKAPIGSRHGMAKLTEEDALSIAQSDLPNADLMRMYGVSKPTIQGIRTGKKWIHLSFQRKHDPIKRGTAHRLSKLDDKNVREIRASTLTNSELAEKMGVSAVAISCVRLNKTWKHVK